MSIAEQIAQSRTPPIAELKTNTYLSGWAPFRIAKKQPNWTHIHVLKTSTAELIAYFILSFQCFQASFKEVQLWKGKCSNASAEPETSKGKWI